MSKKFSEEYKELREILKDDDGNEELYNSILDKFGIDLSEMEENLYSTVNLEYTSEDNRELSYAYETDSGFDLYANEEVHLSPFGRALIPTGIRFNVPPFHEIQVRSKSGLAINRGLMVLNSPGTVDQGYTGEIKIIIFNASDVAQTIEKGTKVAQAVLSSCIPGKSVHLIKTDEIKPKDRNNNGFGSTGI
jgi:dUTP pyrophosphatase